MCIHYICIQIHPGTYLGQKKNQKQLSGPACCSPQCIVRNFFMAADVAHESLPEGFNGVGFV